VGTGDTVPDIEIPESTFVEANAGVAKIAKPPIASVKLSASLRSVPLIFCVAALMILNESNMLRPNEIQNESFEREIWSKRTKK
jgi:hypothetical protein